MTIASLLLALVAPPRSRRPTARRLGAVLLDFHAEWCGPCRQMRPAVEQLVRNGYPVKSIDIDQSPRLARATTSKRCRRSSWSTARVKSSTAARALSRPPSWRGSTRPPRPRHSHRPTPTPTSARTRRRRPPDDDDDQRDPDRGHTAARRRRSSRAKAPSRPQPAFKNPKPWETVVRIRVLEQAFHRLRLGHGHPQHARGIADSRPVPTSSSSTAASRPAPLSSRAGSWSTCSTATCKAPIRRRSTFSKSVEGKAVDYDFTATSG